MNDEQPFIETGVEDGEEVYRLTSKGAILGVEAVKLYKNGYSHEDIAFMLGLEDPQEVPEDEYDPALSVRILVAMVEMNGILDIPEVEEYINEGL